MIGSFYGRCCNRRKLGLWKRSPPNKSLEALIFYDGNETDQNLHSLISLPDLESGQDVVHSIQRISGAVLIDQFFGHLSHLAVKQREHLDQPVLKRCG